MKVAIDARELAAAPAGVGRYLAELLTEWNTAGLARRHDIQLFTHRPLSHVPRPWSEATTIVPGSGGTAWEQWTFARALHRARPDVLFSPGYTAPLAVATPSVIAIHDVSFFAHPEWYTWREGTRRRVVTSRAARRARTVLAPSAFSAGEIVRFTAMDARRLRIVSLGVRPPEEPIRETRSPLVLFVGSLFERRRIDVLIDAFRAVSAAHPEARLEIVGANRTRPRVDYAAYAADRGLGARVRLRDWVDDGTVQALYREAAVFVFLSKYEGFGFTPLEAMAHGAVPIVLDTPVAREIYGEAAWRVADGPDLVRDVGAAIGRLLEAPAARAPFRAAAKPVLASYRWADTAARTWTAIEEATRRND
jgi:glycosyltransferase involved in cell wall biosynthesis